MRKICLGMVGLTLCTLSVMAQSRKVTGRVVSKEDGEPIIGASIIAKGTSIGTVTDFDGNFTLEVAEGATLEISYLGYATQTITAGVNMNVLLAEDSELLEEVVVAVLRCEHGIFWRQFLACLEISVNLVVQAAFEFCAHACQFLGVERDVLEACGVG